MKQTLKIAIFGASGLVGGHLTQLALENSGVSHVVIFVRKPLDLQHPKLEQHLTDFSVPLNLSEFDSVFCCLGTTIKQAKSKEAFRYVDYELPLKIAQADPKELHVITASGSSKHSPFFYSRVKGELEAELKTLQLKQLYIYRPGLLLGRPKGSRLMEDISSRILEVIPSFGMAIEAKDVARVMLSHALKDNLELAGVKVLHTSL